MTGTERDDAPLRSPPPGTDDPGETGIRRLLEALASRRAGDETSGPAEPPRELGDFRLIREIGRGGMGVVWEAEQISLRRRVALKLLSPHRSLSDTDVERFRREAVAGGRLSHPGIVSTYEIGEADGVHFIAQELVPGCHSLADLIVESRDQAELPSSYYRDVAELFARAADALGAAHEAGVVHRDVKPGNILVTPEGRPKVADFGLAKINDDLVLSRTGELAGTPFYMSPEQAASKRIGIDHRTDVFSLGATLYEALTLRRPFEGDTSQQVLEQILLVEPPDPRGLRSKVPWDLSVICLKALEKQRERRYASMADLAADLRRYLEDQPILARPPGTLTRAVKWTRRHKTASVAMSVGALALVVITGLLFRTIQAERRITAHGRVKDEALARALEAEMRTADERDRALEAEAAAAIEAGKAKWQSYLANLSVAKSALEASEHGEAQRRLTACPEELRGWEWHHLSLRADPSLRVLGGRGSSVEFVYYSADGRHILSATQAGDVTLWDAESGESIRVMRGMLSASAKLAYEPGNSQLAAGSIDGTVALWDMLTGEVLLQERAHQRPVNLVRFSPTGSWLASASISGELVLWDGEARQRIKTIDTGSRIGEMSISADGRRLALSQPTDGEDRIRVLDVASTQVLAVLDDRGRPSGLTRDGSRLVTQIESSISLWDVDHRQLLDQQSFAGVNKVVLSPAGTHVVVDGYAENVLVPVGEEFGSKTKLFGEGFLGSIAFSSDGQRIVAAIGDAVYLYDTTSGHMRAALLGHAGEVNVAQLSPDGRYVVSGSDDGTLRIWDPTIRDFDPTTDLPVQWIRDLRFRADGRELVTVSLVGVIVRWDARTGDRLSRWRPETDGCQCAALDQAGSRAALGYETGRVSVHDVVSGDEVAAFEALGGPVRAVALSAEGRWLAASVAGEALLWDLDSGAEAGRMRRHWWDPISFMPMAFYEIAVSPDGRFVAAGDYDGHVQLWSTSTGVPVELSTNASRVTGLDFEAVDGRLYVGCSDGSVHVWEEGADDWVLSMRGHDDSVNSARVSPDGLRLITSGSDATTRVWTADSGELLVTLRTRATGFQAACASPDASRIVGATQRSLQFFETDRDRLREFSHAADRRERVKTLVGDLMDVHLFPAAAADAIAAESLSKELEQAAVEMVQGWGEPSRNEISGFVHRHLADRHADVAIYRALSTAGKRLEAAGQPEAPLVRAVAAYRLRAFVEARSILTQAFMDAADASESERSVILAVLAMVHHGLGETGKARLTLEEAAILHDEKSTAHAGLRLFEEAVDLIGLPGTAAAGSESPDEG